MIVDSLDYLLASYSRTIRKMGYLREILGIRARRNRWWYAWQPHLEQAQAVVRKAIPLCSNRRKAVVLGSGMLYDIPLEELSKAFREVILVDVVHPIGVRLRKRKFPNVRLLTADVTDTVDRIYTAAQDSSATLPLSEPKLFFDDPEVDLVASMNLLSQLPYIPTSWLRRCGKHPEDRISALGKQLIEAHLRYLRAFHCPACLITDLTSIMLDTNERPLETVDILYGVQVPWPGEEWTWRLAPRPEVCSDHSFYRRVRGIVNVNAF